MLKVNNRNNTIAENDKVDLSKYENHFSFYNKCYRCCWYVVYWTFFRPFGASIFRKWRIFILNLFGANISYNALVHASVIIWSPRNLEMLPFSCLGKGVDCYNQGKITIKESAVVSQKSYLCASTHDISDKMHPLIVRPILIEDQAWVAANAFIGPGVVVGQGAVVGACAAVFKNVEPWNVVGGNPATFIKMRILRAN